jgi:hypothetical protein
LVEAVISVKYDSATTHFLQPWGLVVTLQNLHNIADYINKTQGKLIDTESGDPLLSHYIRDQININTGIEFKNFQVTKHFFDEDTFLIKFYCPESYTMFKLRYSGAVTTNN